MARVLESLILKDIVFANQQILIFHFIKMF